MGSAVNVYLAPHGTIHDWLHDHPTIRTALKPPRRFGLIARDAQPRDLTADEAADLADAMFNLGQMRLSWSHSSGGGDWFRNTFLTQIAAPRFGVELMDRLVYGPILGLTFPDIPSCGLWTQTEIVVAHRNAQRVTDDGLDADDAREIRDMRTVLREAHDGRHELFACYA